MDIFKKKKEKKKREKKLPQREYLEVIETKVGEVLCGGQNWRLGESGVAARKWNRWL